MRCVKARRLIGDYIDGNIDSEKGSSLEVHLKDCADCQRLLHDFQKITASAKNLKEPLPSGQTWFKVASRLKAEKQRAEASEPGVGKKYSFFLFPKRLRYAFSAALVLLIAGSAVYFSLQYRNRGEMFSKVNSQQYALAKLEEAEQHYKSAIKALWDAVSSQEKSLDPQIVAVFQRNLNIIDASIAACKQVVQSDPNSVDSRNYLLAAYKEKTDLLAEMVSAQDKFSPKRELEKTF